MERPGIGVHPKSAESVSAENGHYFENPAHRDAAIRCILEGVLPLRFAYAGSAAYTHDRLARTAGYRSVIGSVDVEVQTLLDAGFPTQDLSLIVEIGPGNGVHTVSLLRTLSAISGVHCQSYLGLDFSATLLDIACSHICETFSAAISVSSNVWDIEAGKSEVIERWRSGLGHKGPLLTCLLGHTLGNLESDARAIGNVHDSLRAGDMLLAGLSLRHPGMDEDVVLMPYRTEVFRAAALEPMRAAGIDSCDIEFRVRFADDVVIGEATFLRNVQVGASTLPPGHIVRCFCSRRFAMEDVLLLFRESGWVVRAVVVDDLGEHAVVAALRGAP